MGVMDDTMLSVFGHDSLPIPAGSMVERRVTEEVAALDAAILRANQDHELRIANIHAQFANRVRHITATAPVAVPDEFNAWTQAGELPG